MNLAVPSRKHFLVLLLYHEDYFLFCPNCSKPQIVSPRDRFQIFFDNGQYEELNHKITTNHDPLDWEDLKKYKDKVKAARKTYKQDSAVLCAEGLLNGSKVQAVVFNSQFLGGSFGIPEPTTIFLFLLILLILL